MRIRVLRALALFLLLAAPAIASFDDAQGASSESRGAQESALWLRYPAISPDGRTIAFEYKGDIWIVPAAGGTATPLTIGEAYDFAPVWSHDGRQIAAA